MFVDSQPSVEDLSTEELLTLYLPDVYDNQDLKQLSFLEALLDT